ncbi:hypothetical protein D3C80_1752970 [compost metagenome]
MSQGSSIPAWGIDPGMQDQFIGNMPFYRTGINTLVSGTVYDFVHRRYGIVADSGNGKIAGYRVNAKCLTIEYTEGVTRKCRCIYRCSRQYRAGDAVGMYAGTGYKI